MISGRVAGVPMPLASFSRSRRASSSPFGQHAIYDHSCEDKEAQRHHDQDNY